MFRALLAHPQEVLHKQHLVYCVRVESVGCTKVKVELISTLTLVRPTGITCTQYAKCCTTLCGSSAQSFHVAVAVGQKECLSMPLLFRTKKTAPTVMEERKHVIMGTVNV
jgi:hypothetical protein